MLKPVILLALFLALPLSAFAGKYNPTLSPGDAAPSWEKIPGTDGKEHALADLKDKAFVVVVFTCNSCPTAVDYEDRLLALSKLVADKNGAVVAFSSNDTRRAEEDSLEGMQAKAKAKGFDFAYLRDEEQTVARAYGATFTPEFIVLDKDRKVVYLGALDDSTSAESVKVKYVEEAIVALLANKAPETAETVARGCTVRYRRVRQ